MTERAQAPRRLNAYVDGFNLYFGCLADSRFRWLDLDALCRTAIPLTNFTLNRIRYFTAPVIGDPEKHRRQQIYLRALRTITNLTICEGHFLNHPKEMRLVNGCPSGQPPGCNPTSTQRDMALVYHRQEKGTDVNLATYLLFDAMKQDCDVGVVVSNDSDLVAPIRIAQAEFGLPVGVLNPQIGKDRFGRLKKPSHQLRSVAQLFFAPIWPAALAKCQFPPTVIDAKGVAITKPLTW